MEGDKQTTWLNANCPDGGFLQSEGWRAFKEREGFCMEHFEGEGLWANAIEHTLPLVGKYWYIPRGPVMEQEAMNSEQGAEKRERELRNQTTTHKSLLGQWQKILDVAKKKDIGWIRVEPESEEKLAMLCAWSKQGAMKKAPHDMQPREILVTDISKSEEEILTGMKSKTRYNIRLAEKRGVEVSLDRDETSIQEFLRMIRETAMRNHIASHPEKHYSGLLHFFSRETLEFFVARRHEKILAGILVVFFGDTATYFHGASFDNDRAFMAPHLLQWRAIQEAKKRGCRRYDFGGVDTDGMRPTLAGVTRFKQGFAESVKTVRYPGSYDRVLIPSRFFLYRAASMSKSIAIKAMRRLTKE